MDKKFKLCFSIPELESDTPTHHFHLYELLEELGKEVSILLVVDKPTVKPYRFENIQKVHLTRFDFFPLRKLEQSICFLLARVRGCETFYIHYSLWNALITSLITMLLGGRTFLWNCHVYRRPRLKEVRTVETLRKWFNGRVQGYVFQWVDRVVTGTPSIVSDYGKEFGTPINKFVVLPNWVNSERFRSFSPCSAEKARRKIVAFVHSLTKEKGAAHLPFIIKEVMKDLPETAFLIIGDGFYKESVRDEVRRAGLADRVDFLGYVANLDVPKYLSRSDLLIVPSENEGFPRVLLEAMAMGIPFVATDVGGIMDIVAPPQTDYIVPKGDIEGFSKKVISLLEDDAMREKFSKFGLERVKEYTLEKATERFKKMIISTA